VDEAEGRDRSGALMPLPCHVSACLCMRSCRRRPGPAQPTLLSFSRSASVKELKHGLHEMSGASCCGAGASIAAGPVLAVSMLAPDYQQSFAALLVGFALSECWRAPSAIMVRDVSPPDAGSTASAIHLCIRNFIGGCGPLGELAAPSPTSQCTAACCCIVDVLSLEAPCIFSLRQAHAQIASAHGLGLCL